MPDNQGSESKMDTEQADADLSERLARLEAENSALRTELEARPSGVPDGQGPTRRPRGPWWTVLATVLILIGCLLAPLAVISGWAKSTLTDTDTFVATYAPLAHNPEVQSFVVDQAAVAVNQHVDVEQLTSEVIDGIKELGTRPRASAALDALKGPATQGIQTLIHNGITAFVGSDAFAQSWERALRFSHTQLLATLSNDPQALIAAQSDGTIGVQLGPIVEDVKAALLARGVSIASRIPAVDRTIPIAQADQIPSIQAAYRTIIAVGSWLPWVALISLTAGVLVARRRSVALLWAAVGLGLSMLVLVLGFAIGRAVLLTAVPAALVPGNVTTVLYDTATAAMKDTATVGLVLAITIAVVGWFAGPFQAPRKLRGFYTDGLAGMRRNAEQHGVTTGRVGDWLYAQRRVLHVVIGLAALAALILIRPLSFADIMVTLLITVLALIILSIVERPEPVGPPQSLVEQVAT
jgi:hypothetical protein